MLLVEIFDNLYQRLASARQLSKEVSIHVCMTFWFFQVPCTGWFLSFSVVSKTNRKRPNLISLNAISNATTNTRRCGTNSVPRKRSSNVSTGMVFVIFATFVKRGHVNSTSRATAYLLGYVGWIGLGWKNTLSFSVPMSTTCWYPSAAMV